MYITKKEFETLKNISELSKQQVNANKYMCEDTVKMFAELDAILIRYLKTHDKIRNNMRESMRTKRATNPKYNRRKAK